MLRRFSLAYLLLIGMAIPCLAAGHGDGGHVGGDAASDAPDATTAGMQFLFSEGLGREKDFEKEKKSNKAVLICYDLVKLSKAKTPFTLVPASSLGEHCWDRSKSDDDDPLTSGQRLWIAIDADSDDADKIITIVLNVTSKAGSPLNPTPIRYSASIASLVQSGKANLENVIITESNVHKVYYFRWPYRLRGDMTNSIAVTAQPSEDDQDTYTMGSDVLPQTHSLSRFNISTAVVFSSIHNKTFGYNSDATPKPMVTGRNPIIDPVLFLTYYPHPIDADRDFQWSDMIPGVSLGLSLSNPVSNFYLGGMSEFPGIRNVEVVYGVTVAKTSSLAPQNTFLPAPTAQNQTPPTVQKFSTGGYVGLSFNVSGFLTSLFGKGG